MRRNDVASTSFRRHVPTRFLINQCQIITFLILKFDNIENSRIELKGIVLQVRSNQIKVTSLQLCTFVIFSCFTSKLKENVGGLLGGGAKGYVGPPSQIIGGPGPSCPPPPPPLPTPMILMSIQHDRQSYYELNCMQRLICPNN